MPSLQLGAAERHRGRPQKETVPKTQAEPAVSERCDMIERDRETISAVLSRSKARSVPQVGHAHRDMQLQRHAGITV